MVVAGSVSHNKNCGNRFATFLFCCGEGRGRCHRALWPVWVCARTGVPAGALHDYLPWMLRGSFTPWDFTDDPTLLFESFTGRFFTER